MSQLNQLVLILAFILCTATQLFADDTLQHQEMNQRDDMKGLKNARRIDGGCVGCQVGLSTVQPLLDGLTSDLLFPYLQPKCNSLTNKAEKELCMTFTSDRGDMLGDMIKYIFAPQRFCELVRAC